jgi:hypothetical protein
VVRIDIVDGSTLNIAGLAGQVANVIVKAGGAKGQFEYRPEFRAHNTDPVLMRGAISLSGETGPFGYTIGCATMPRQRADGRTRILSGAGAVTDIRDEFFASEINQPKISGSLKYDGPGTQVGNLSASAQIFHFDFLELSERSGPGQVDRVRRFTTTEREYNYEVSG